MAKKIRQIDFNEALEIARKNGKVFVITCSDKPTIRKFTALTIGSALNEKSDSVFAVFEEVANEN